MDNRPTIHITELRDTGDARGRSFSLGALLTARVGAVEDAHLATIVPGAIRGNHYHVKRREAILVLYFDAWTLYHDEGEGTAPLQRPFQGEGAVLLDVDPLCGHAIQNTGSRDLTILGCSNGPYDEKKPDAVRRELV